MNVTWKCPRCGYCADLVIDSCGDERRCGSCYDDIMVPHRIHTYDDVRIREETANGQFCVVADLVIEVFGHRVRQNYLLDIWDSEAKAEATLQWYRENPLYASENIYIHRE